MTKQQSLALYNSLLDFANQNISGTKFNYCLLRNLNLLSGEIQAIQDAQRKNEKFMEFEKQRIELIKKYAQKDEKGDLKIKDGNYDLPPESIKELTKEVEGLSKKYAEPIKEINDFLNQPCEVSLFKISIDELPKELDAGKIDKLMEIIL